MTTKQKQLSPQPATKSKPQIVEKKWGSSVITQSTDENDTISNQMIIDGPEKAVALPK